MNIFESLPHVDKCCFCVDLNYGCIMIALTQLSFVGEAFLGNGSNTFNKCYASGTAMTILSYVGIVVAAFILFTALYFLYGMLNDIPDTVIWFMYASSLLLVYNAIISVYFFMKKTKKNCHPTYILGAMTLGSVLMQCYFLVVLASYHRVMMYR